LGDVDSDKWNRSDINRALKSKILCGGK
jgi:hypothetical protein